MTISGCEAAKPAETEAAITAATTAQTTRAAALADEDETVVEKIEKPLVIAINDSDLSYTPFGASNTFDTFMNDVTGAKLLGTDRSGNIIMKGASGERSEYMGNNYGYSGLCDVTSEYDEENDRTQFLIKLLSTVTFTDGEDLTSDDLIFTLYALLDPSYRGSIDLYGTDIIGAVNYRLNSMIADTITEEEISEAFGSDELKEIIKNEIVIPVLTEEFRTVKTLYRDSAYEVYTNAYPDPKNLMAFFYSVDSEYRPDPDAEDSEMIAELADMYGGNFTLLGSMVRGEESFYAEQARRLAVAFLTEQQGLTEDVNSISGIEKKGPRTVSITVSGSGSKLLKELTNVVVAPMHYYGDKELYDYENESFGFIKGTAADMIAAKAGSPLGAGAYIFDRSENGTVYLKANEKYYKGKPLINEINIISGTPQTAAAAVASADADIAFPSYSAASLEEIEEANRSIEKLYLNTERNNGYGYIGINAQTVNINGEPMSDKSVSLRKGIAAAIDLFRTESVSEYYGEKGEAAYYPVCGSITVKGYVSPYALNESGEEIYAEDMTASQRRKAAKAAVLEHFVKAGYTVENEKITAAPEGGALEFTAMIAGGGTGDHPAYTALTKASDLLAETGITLNIKDIFDETLLWEAISSGTHTIWAGSWSAPLRTIFTSNYYGMDAARISELLAETEAAADRSELTEAYRKCYLYAADECAVEIPIYKRKTCAVFSSLRIDVSTLPQGISNSYSWTAEIEKLAMK